MGEGVFLDHVEHVRLYDQPDALAGRRPDLERPALVLDAVPDLSSPDIDTAVGAPAVPGTAVELPMGDAASRFFRVKVKIDLP